MDYSYIKDFERLGFGIFVHIGLYTTIGKGEWYQAMYHVDRQEYMSLKNKFKIQKTWAKEIVSAAKKAGARYITISTRHHEGFSLFDTQGLNDYDAPHSACGRDLIREFVDECGRQEIIPFLYHTLLDWYHKDFENNFSEYLKYLRKSVEILCTNYGKIGGFWFDGQWAKPNEDWEEDKLYALIRKYQPDAIIINNTGLSEQGKTGHREIDSVTFERGKPVFVDKSEKYIAGEMCQTLNDHWGNADNDFNYKSTAAILGDLVDCRVAGCNFLLNLGVNRNGTPKILERAILVEIGKWIRFNKEFIYEAKPTKNVKSDGASILYDGKYYYAIIKDVPMSADPNVAINSETGKVMFFTDKKIRNALWLDNGKRVKIRNNCFKVEPFFYGNSGVIRVLRFQLK